MQGMPVIEIVNWDKHQKVDKPQPKLALPPIAAKNIENTSENAIRDSFANHSLPIRELVAPHTPTYDPDQEPDLRPTTESRESNHSRTVRDDPPTLDDVTNYVAFIGKDTGQAASIFDFYSANGWVQGSKGKPIIDWHAAVRAWFRNDLSKPASARGSPSTFAQQRVKNTQQAIEEFASET